MFPLNRKLIKKDITNVGMIIAEFLFVVSFLYFSKEYFGIEHHLSSDIFGAVFGITTIRLIKFAFFKIKIKKLT